ncbi:MAG: response regulator [Bacteroidota bacterium]
MSDKKHKAVLLVDDDSTDNYLNKKTIESNNFAEKIYLSTNALSAVELLQNFEEYNTEMLPDVIFLDLDMPFIDGFEFLDRFEEFKPETIEKCKVVILTSSINPADAERSEIYSFVRKYLRKPLTEENLNTLSF